MLNQFRNYLGPNRFNALILLLIISGVGSIIFTLVPGEGAVAAQTLLLLFFILVTLSTLKDMREYIINGYTQAAG